jgi:hypothetical protein
MTDLTIDIEKDHIALRFQGYSLKEALKIFIAIVTSKRIVITGKTKINYLKK